MIKSIRQKQLSRLLKSDVCRKSCEPKCLSLCHSLLMVNKRGIFCQIWSLLFFAVFSVFVISKHSYLLFLDAQSKSSYCNINIYVIKNTGNFPFFSSFVKMRITSKINAWFKFHFQKGKDNYILCLNPNFCENLSIPAWFIMKGLILLWLLPFAWQHHKGHHWDTTQKQALNEWRNMNKTCFLYHKRVQLDYYHCSKVFLNYIF